VGAINALFCQHHASADGYLPSPLLLASAAASQTRTLPITVGALLLLMYDPVKLAEDIAVLDHLSGGRVNYIVGLGYRNAEYAMFGVDPGQRGKQMEEYLDVLSRALKGEAFEWRGRAIDVRPRPRTANAAMLGYGGGTLAAARRAGSRGMPFMPQSADPALQAAYDEAAAAAGNPTGNYRVVPKGFPTSLFVAEDVDRAWDEIGPYLLHDAMVYSEWLDAVGAGASTYSGAKSVEALRAENGSYRIVTPEQAVALIGQYGFLGLHPQCGGIPPALAWRSLKLIEEQVLPAVRR
jgi:alkanesulfonate monooxygenase SsuD/methylene tetrahydromethanopterin reductase-like flavin-dependent oxidoreductase (luciferase family)